MSKLPSFQFYPADWRKDPAVQSLDFFERGVWIELLCLMHESDERGYLMLNGQPLQDKIIARLLGLELSKWEEVKSSLLLFGVCSVDTKRNALYCRRMVRDTIAIREYKKSKIKAGKASAESRKHNHNRGLDGKFATEHNAEHDTEHNAEQQPNSSSSSSSSLKERGNGRHDPDADASDTLSVQDAGVPTPTSASDASPSSHLRVSAEGVASLNGAARPGRGSRLPDTFLLTAAMRAYAESRAPEIDVMLETEKFVNYFRAASGAKGVKLDWEATWRNWILNAKKFATDKEPVTQKKQGIVW